MCRLLYRMYGIILLCLSVKYGYCMIRQNRFSVVKYRKTSPNANTLVINDISEVKCAGLCFSMDHCYTESHNEPDGLSCHLDIVDIATGFYSQDLVGELKLECIE